MFQVTYTPRKSLSMYFNYRYKQKERDVTGTSGAVIEPIYHHKLRYRLTYMPGRYIFRTTITIRVFTPPSVDCYILSIPLPSMAKGSVTPLICDMI